MRVAQKGESALLNARLRAIGADRHAESVHVKINHATGVPRGARTGLACYAPTKARLPSCKGYFATDP